MFFVNTDDLTNLDVASGHCYNASVPQNLTFGYQGLPFSSQSAVNGSANGSSSAAAPASSVQLGLSFVAFLSAVVWQVL